MSDVMLFGVLKMPYEMAMESELSRIQFYQRVQQLVARVEAQQPQRTEQEPVGKVVEAVEGAFRCEFTAPLPAGTKLYTTPPQRERVVFPTMLRKMWSGGEVQAWLDENVNKEKNA